MGVGSETTGRASRNRNGACTRGPTSRVDLAVTSTRQFVKLKQPLRVWYGMLDQAGINALVLYTLNPNNAKLTRVAFLESLSFDLVKPLFVERYFVKALRILVKMIIKNSLNLPEENRTCQAAVGNKLAKRGRCGYC